MRKSWAPLFGAAIAVGLGAVACSPKYHLRATEAESPVLSGDCTLRVFEKAPEQAYTLLGTIEPDDPAKLADNEQDFLASIREAACKRAADAVIVDRDESGHYTRGTLIRLH